MAKKDFIPRSKPKYRIDPKAIHTARRKLQSRSKDGKIDFSSDEREALLQLISDGKKALYPHKMAIDRYHSDLNEITKIDLEDLPEKGQFFFKRIAEFEEKYCK